MNTSLIARTVHGLEWLCAEEIEAFFPTAAGGLGFDRRELTFTLPRLDPHLLELRTVDDIFVSVGRVDGVGTTKDAPAGLARRLLHLPFAERVAAIDALRRLSSGPRFDVVASLEGRRNYNRFAVESAVGEALASLLRGEFLERDREGRAGGEPDLTVRVFVRGSTASAALRLGARPLHRRAYKQATGPGTLHPPVAAALARLVAARPPTVLLDPFCGDATILIESALAYPDAAVVGSDLDPVRLANARANAARAHAKMSLVRADAAHPPWREGSVDTVITNPPWNLAVDARGGLGGSLRQMWRLLPRILDGQGRLCAVFDAGLDPPATLQRLGWTTVLSTQIRLAGRMSHLVLAAPPGRPAPVLPAGQATWRARAVAAGVVTEEGF